MESIIVDQDLTLRYEAINDNLRVSTLRSTAKPNDWSFQAIRKHEKDNGHNCYGTTMKDSSSYFLIDVSDAHCNNPNLKVPCAIEVDLIHSWDSQYVSNSLCILYALKWLPDTIHTRITKTKAINTTLDSANVIYTININHNECPVEDSGHTGHGNSAHKRKHASHKRQVQGTFPCTHTIPLLRASPKVALKCTSLESSKLTCISKVALTYVT